MDKLIINGGTPISMVINNSQVLYIMMNLLRIWPIIPDTPEIFSCFGLGYWSDEDPWTDDLPWLNEYTLEN